MPRKDKEQTIRELLKDPKKLGIDIDAIESDLEVDKFNLDTGWDEQTGLFTKWGKEAMYCFGEHLYAWEMVKTIRSEIILETKGTAQEKEAKYRTNERYRQAKKQAIIAEAKWWYMERIVVQAFHQRKTELVEKLKQWQSEYYSEPTTSKEDYKKLEEGRRNRANTKTKTKRRR